MMITYRGRTYHVRDGVVYISKLSKAGVWHWARVPPTYRHAIAAVLALHEKAKSDEVVTEGEK